MNKIVSIKNTSAIFLATLLVLGTISTILPSVQAQPYYEDTYEADYPSYSQDYEQEYPSYKPDYKSKDSSSSVINKIKCNNINSNNNGVDVSLGVPNNDNAIAEAQTADNEGQETTANGLYGERNGYKQKDNGFKFVCVNNNDNENNVVVVNETTPTPPPPPPDTITCEECFEENLTPEQLAGLNSFLETRLPSFLVNLNLEIDVDDLASYCTVLSLSLTEEALSNSVQVILLSTNVFLPPEDVIPDAVFEEIIQCILEALDIDTDTNDITGGLATSFSSPSTIAQGTEEDSSTLEKLTKLKQQWMELLP